jgi:hypothetical protein
MLPLRPRATAAAGWRWRCCLLHWLLFIRALWLDWTAVYSSGFTDLPSSFNTALQLVLRPHFLVHFVLYDVLAIWFGPEPPSLVVG